MMPRTAICCCLFVLVCAGMREIATAQTEIASQANRPTASNNNPNRPASATAADESVQSNRFNEDGSLAVSDQQDAALRFRRVYLPLSQILDRSGKTRRYLPMDLDEFEERIQRLSDTVTPPPMGAQILAARYEASLDEGSQWVGEGQWTVKHSASTPVLLAVSPCGVALTDPHWTSDKPETRVPASLGTASNTNVALRVDRSGELRFAWSLRPTIDDAQDLSYSFAIPEAPSSELVLRAPADRVLIAEGATLSADESTDETAHVWRIRLRGNRPLKVTLLAPGRTPGPKPINVLRPVVNYDMKPSGMQVTADWRLDVLGESLQQLVVDLDSELELVQAQHAGQELRVTTADSRDGRQRAVIHLAQPTTGANQQLRLIAVAPLKVDGGWRLPRIAATNVVTQDAKATLVVAAPLRLTNVSLKDCRQLSREQGTSPDVETIELECLSNNYQAEVELSAGIDQLRYTSASVIDAQPNEARIRYVCDITCHGGERFQLAAELSPEWIIDSVNSSPSDMLTDWEVVRSGASPSRLITHLAKPINPDRSLRLIVTAQRRRAPLRDILRASDFSVLTFPGIKPARRLAVLHTDTAHRLDVQPEYAVARLDLAGLDAADAALLGDEQPGFGFVLDDRADDLEIRLVPETPEFSADIDVQGTIFDGRLREDYTIACNPESNKVDQVLVHFSSARESEPEWTLNGETVIAATQKLDVDEQRRIGLSGSGDTWRLRFRAPTDQRFVLRRHCGRARLATSSPLRSRRFQTPLPSVEQ